jgi:hypothetical protein
MVCSDDQEERIAPIFKFVDYAKQGTTKEDTLQQNFDGLLPGYMVLQTTR